MSSKVSQVDQAGKREQKQVLGKQALLCPLDPTLSCRNCSVVYEIKAIKKKLENAVLSNLMHSTRKFLPVSERFFVFSLSHSFWRFSHGTSWGNLPKWNLY